MTPWMPTLFPQGQCCLVWYALPYVIGPLCYRTRQRGYTVKPMYIGDVIYAALGEHVHTTSRAVDTVKSNADLRVVRNAADLRSCAKCKFVTICGHSVTTTAAHVQFRRRGSSSEETMRRPTIARSCRFAVSLYPVCSFYAMQVPFPSAACASQAWAAPTCRIAIPMCLMAIRKNGRSIHRMHMTITIRVSTTCPRRMLFDWRTYILVSTSFFHMTARDVSLPTMSSAVC